MFFKPKSYLGINIGAGGVKLVELQSQKKRPALFTYGYISESEDLHKLEARAEQLHSEMATGEGGAKPQKEHGLSIAAREIKKYGAIIREVCREAKSVSKDAAVNLPASAVFHTVVTLPILKKEELRKNLNTEIKKLLPRSLKEMAVDYQILPASTGAKTQRVLVNAVSDELIALYSRIFQAAGLKLRALEPGSSALARSLVGRDPALAMIVDMGAERTNFFVVDETAPITHQSIEIGGNKIGEIIKNVLKIEEDLIEQIKYDLGQYYAASEHAARGKELLSVFMPVIEPIVKEIEYGFEVYLRQSGNENKRPEKIILTGGASFLPYLSQHISETFKMKCYIGDPWARVVYQEDLRPILRKIGPRMAMAIGLALRSMV